MFRTSVSRLLVTLQLLTIAGLIVTSGAVAYHALGDYGSARAILDGVAYDRTLFDAVIKVRRQIPVVQTALLTEESPTASIETVERVAADRIAAVVAGEHGQLPPGMVDEITARWTRFTAARHVLNEQIAKTRADRRITSTEPWVDAIYAVEAKLLESSTFVSNSVRITDPVVAEMVELRRLAWLIRDNFGQQCSLIRANVAENRPLSRDAVQRWHSFRGGYTAGWGSVAELMARPGFSPDLAQRIQAARVATEQTQQALDPVIYGLGLQGEAGKPAMESAAFTKLCNAPFESVLAVAYGALDEAVRHAEDRRAGALGESVTAGIGLLLALGLTIATLLGIRFRLVKPIR